MDMRSHVESLEREGLLHRVTEPVDPETEIGPLSRWIYHGLDDDDRFALYFEDVEGSDVPVVTLALGASRRTYAAALVDDPDASPEDLRQAWLDALEEPREPVVVDDPPAQEQVRESDASLEDLPVPVWTPRKDVGPYVTALVVTSDRETGTQNLATYRCQVKGPRTIALNIHPGAHGYRNVETWTDEGDAAPVAIALAADPAAHLGAIANVPYDTDEATVAGGLLGEGLEMTRARTSDLLVPASAEFVIEGTVDPDAHTTEGPFGEFAGYMGPVGEKPVFSVSAITHRNDPFYYGYLSQMPPSESTTIQSLSNAPLYYDKLHSLGYTAVTDLYVDRTYGGTLAHGVVAVDTQYGSHAMEVGRVLANASSLKRVTVVDTDIDIRDPFHRSWALNARYNPTWDTHVIDDVDSAIDPAARQDERNRSVSSKVVRDATVTLSVEDGQAVPTAPGLSIPSKDLMEHALDRWDELDLPALEPKPRMERMLEDHPGPGPDSEG